MNIHDIELENCLFYSESHRQLVENLALEPAKAREVARRIEQMPFPEFGLAELELFEISPWPLVISNQWETRFDDFIKGIAPLLWKALLVYFGDDSEKFAEHTGMPVVVHEILKNAHLNPYNLFARHDVMVSHGEIKLLEVNSGSAIGGWELSLIERRMADALSLMTNISAGAVSAISIFAKLFNCLATQIKTLPTKDSSGNILFVFEKMPPKEVQGLIFKELQRFYESSPDYEKGRVIVTDRDQDICFGSDGEVYFDGEIINGVLKAGARFRVQLTVAEVSGHLVYPDSMLYKVLAQKSLLAIAHKPEVKAQLTAAECAFVDRHIPFTATLDEQIVVYYGKQQSLEQLLLQNRTDFVIKKSNSLAGKDVLVGCFTDPELWEETVEMLIGNAHWIAQAYCQADKFLEADKSCTLTKYTPVWGIFAFENSYCGAFVRANSDDKGNGVINSATGALEFAVLEERRESDSGPVDTNENISEPAMMQASRNSYTLSDAYGKLTEALLKNSERLPSLIENTPRRTFPAYAEHGLKTYPLSHWPLLIDQDTVEKFEIFVSSYEQMLRQVIDYCFVQNLDTWGDYLGHGRFLLSLFAEQPINYDNLLMRHDTLMSNGTLKMLEANVGCSIGGWEIELFDESTLDAVEQLMPIERRQYGARKFLENMFGHFAVAIGRLKLKEKTGNILFISKPMEPKVAALFCQQLQEVYQQQDAYQGGRIILGMDSSLINIDENAVLRYQGEVFNALVMPDLSANPSLAFNVTRAVIAGQVISADSPLFELLGNKAMMALFHEPEVLASLDEKLRLFVEESVPYTVKMDQQMGLYKGMRVSLKEMLIRYQKHFVLKKTDSSHGVDVYVGRFCTDAKWLSLVVQRLGDKEWIAQAYCEPDAIIAADHVCNVSEFLPVWGLFSVGGRYGGSQVRAEDKKKRFGVVNTHQGAGVFAVLEALTKQDVVEDDFYEKQAVNSGYSNAFANMCEFYARQKTHTGHVLPFTLEGLPKFMGFHEELHYLPLIVSRQLIADFDEFIKGYPPVVLQAIKAMLGDEYTFAAELNESPLLFNVINEQPPRTDELMFRYDIHCDGQHLRMLEANLGTVIGGWEADWLEDRVRSRIASFEHQHDAIHHYRRVTPQMFRSIIDGIIEMKGHRASGVLLVGTEAERSDEWISFENALEQVFETVKQGGYCHGKVVFFHDWQALDFSCHGKVLYEGAEVDAVFTTTPALENKKPGILNVRLMTAYLAGNLVFPDSPLHQIFGNKLVMPLLHRYKESGLANEQDINFIERFIPWSARLNVLLLDENSQKMQLIKNAPENYVLKKAASSKGNDVVVGKFCDAESWWKTIERVQVEGDWLVQEYCPASQIYLPDQGKLVANDMVLAIYALRDKYSGAWARVVRQCDTGVINVGQGAVPMLVLEELEQQQVVTI